MEIPILRHPGVSLVAMSYRLIIFDFDGTLADSFAWAAGLVNQFADQYGFRHIDPEERESLRVLDAKTLIQHLGVPTWKVPIMAAHVRKLMGEQIDRIPLFEGIGEQLQCLAASGATLAVVSSNAEQNVRRVLGDEYAGLIRFYECGAGVFGKAPKLKTVVRKSGVAPAQAILVGDELRDQHAAHQAGIAFGAVAWGYTHYDALRAQAPEEYFDQVVELGQRLVGGCAQG
jgi:phosphoglycolate phosphatase